MKATEEKKTKIAQSILGMISNKQELEGQEGHAEGWKWGKRQMRFDSRVCM